MKRIILIGALLALLSSSALAWMGVMGMGGTQIESVPADKCTGGDATASSVYGSYGAGNAFDNDNETAWQTTSTGGANAWLKYDFGSGKAWAINRVILLSACDTYCNAGSGCWYKNFTVQGSNNDSTWDSLTTGTYTGGTQTFDFENTTEYRYIRLLSAASPNQNDGCIVGTVELFEVEMWVIE